MTPPDMVEGVFYLTFTKQGHAYNASLSTPKVTKGQPTVPRGFIAMKLRMNVPVSLFDTFIPEGTITLPEDASVGRPVLTVNVPEGIEVGPDIELELVPVHPATGEED